VAPREPLAVRVCAMRRGEWAHLDWLAWWRAITQYLLRPGPRLVAGLGSTLSHIALLRSPLAAGSPPADRQLVRATSTRARAEAEKQRGFARRFQIGVARWSAVRRPLIGVHVRLGDGCWDSKRGGCKYVTSFEAVLTRLRQAGLTSGTIFLATDNSTIAEQAVRDKVEGFDVLTLREDRRVVEKSHARGDRRREKDELLHLQLLDLALLSQVRRGSCTLGPSLPLPDDLRQSRHPVATPAVGISCDPARPTCSASPAPPPAP
jgi:hypothetical protein